MLDPSAENFTTNNNSEIEPENESEKKNWWSTSAYDLDIENSER
jgi:hypothetical protein